MAVMGVVSLLLLFSVFKLLSGKDVETCKKHRENLESCKMFARNPFFEPELVVGRPWRIYYTWNMKFGSKCLDIVYRNVTKEIIHRVWSDMNEYLEYQPNWNAAALLLTIGTSRHEMLLFTDQGPAGSFIGVPNVIRDGNIPPLRKAVPLIKFNMKLVANGRFLVVMDCQTGVITLSSRSRNVSPSRSDIASTVAELGFGEGHPACTVDKNGDDHFLNK
ncbi:uncharacterized protein [Battus philenor]|uniref:uncharacterized protein n=1 Tax=Battus philenor TaxID=42288 RepID=UPI0035D0A181